jgi:uncharacterized protein (TIGR02266 family)
MDAPLASDDDRRAAPRYVLKVEVTFESEHNFYTGLTQDLSGGGLFVATNVLRPIGECIRVRFNLPGHSEFIDVVTVVRWVRGHNLGDMEPGMGLQFVQLTPGAQKAVGAFLQQRDSIFYDV